MRPIRWSAAPLMGAALAVAVAATFVREVRSRDVGGYSPSVEVAGAVARPAIYTLDTLRALPVTVVTHRCVTEGTFTLQDHAYRGVLLWSLIERADPTDAAGEPLDSLAGYVLATASDGFPTIIAMAEIDPLLNGRRAIIAYERDGELLDESRGMAMLVLPDDFSCARDIYWLARLEVRSVERP